MPDSWRWEESAAQLSPSQRSPRRPPITDIAVWAECFAVMAGIISARFPDKAQHMFQYLRTIVRASRNFEGSAWVSYDAAFRRQAAGTASFDWGIIDPTLYNEAFTGRARIKARCSHCLADTHHSRACPLAPEEWSVAGSRQTRGESGGARESIHLCGLFNSIKGNICRYSDCLRSAPKIFNAVADVIAWCFRRQGVAWVDHYLDDFIVLGMAGTEECAEGLAVVWRVSRELGVPLAEEKSEGPATVLTFLGIEIDSVQGEIRLPQEKVERL